jgi:valyl-tRNA synthetase
VLDSLLRLLHPMIPFVTETLWTALTGGESVVIAQWPAADTARADKAAEDAISVLQSVITEVRRFRAEQRIKPSEKLPTRITGEGVDESSMRTMLRLVEPTETFAATASLTVGDGVVLEFDLSGAIDVAAERARRLKDLAAAEKERDVNTAKLANEAFTAKAPDDVIAKVQARLDAANADIERITAALEALPEGE